MFWYRIEPLAVDRFRLAIHPCVSPSVLADPAQAEAVAGLRGYVGAIHQQDIGACQGVQGGLRSRLAAPGRLSHLEKPVWQLTRWGVGGDGRPGVGSTRATRRSFDGP